MQVVCGNCQLTFDAPEGTTGLVCPICRNPLQPESAAGGGAPATKKIEWAGGTLPELITLLSAPAVSAVVEVLPPGSDAPIGEVHLIAGGVSDSVYQGDASDDALDRLLTVTGARFRIDPRMPDPATGDLGKPGPESGTLDGRPLAHLMRYCEDYVITCGIEVWRGNETARVDYRRGEISGVTVGGIDAPERLAEVMQWASGNYRLIIPPINLPATAPKQMPVVPAPEPVRAGTKTMFGIPQSEVAAARAAAEAIMAAQGVGTPSPPEVAPPPVAVPEPAPAPAPMPVVTITPPGVPPSAVPAPVPMAARASATKTIFGMAAPSVAEIISAQAATQAASQASAPAPAEAAAPVVSAQVGETDTGRTDRIVKTGARKTAVPAPEIIPPSEAAAPAPAPAKDVGRTTHHGFESRAATGPQKKVEEREKPAEKVPARTTATRPAQRPTAIWTYVGVGFTFGLVLLGIYQLVGRLAH
ncbi:MAG TPA: hypothetical protein VHJ20_18205 [Polyangia bacterium]|nr:hypothetical protein [Polyangia bacterium]